MNFVCVKCGKLVKFEAHTPIGRRDSCAHCGTDLRTCLHCKHYDKSARYECRENIQERVGEKDRGNFCDWFQPRLSELNNNAKVLAGTTQLSAHEAALKAAEALFKK